MFIALVRLVNVQTWPAIRAVLSTAAGALNPIVRRRGVRGTLGTTEHPITYRVIRYHTGIDRCSRGRGCTSRAKRISKACCECRRNKSFGICEAKRIASNIPKPIQSPIKPNRIILRIPPSLGIVRPEVVVEQPSFVVLVLPRKAQVTGRRLRFRSGIVPHLNAPYPNCKQSNCYQSNIKESREIINWLSVDFVG